MEKENKKSKVGIIVICAIIIVAIAAGAFYYINSTKPKNVVVSQINKVADNYREEVLTKKEKTNMTVTLAANVETENETLKYIAQYINDTKLTFNVQADMASKKALMGMDVNYQNSDLIKGNVYYAEDKNIYAFVEGLSDKYLKINAGEALKNIPIGIATDSEKSAKIVQILKNEITSKLDDKYFSKENAEGMTKNIIKISGAELKQKVIEIAKDLRQNQEFLNCFDNKEEIIENLKEIENKLPTQTEYDQYNVEASIYTKGILAKTVEKVEIKVTSPTSGEMTETITKVDNNNVKVELNIPNAAKITLNIGIKRENTTTLDNINVSNSIDVNNISEQEQATLYTNLMNMKIYQLFSSLIPTE